MSLFTVRRGIDARQWYRSVDPMPADMAITVATHGNGDWMADGVTEFDALEVVEIIGPDGIVLIGDEHGDWYDVEGEHVRDPSGYLRSLDPDQPPDDNITDGGELLRLKEIRAGVLAEIAWHEREAKYHREAQEGYGGGDCNEEATLEKYAAIGHEQAAELLRALL